jgi:hypothetical protein
VARVVVTIGSGKRQAWPPTDHFEKLLEEMYPNHAYPVKYKLRDYDIMKNFMVSGSLTWGMEADEDLDEGGVPPFPREDTVMMIYDERSWPGVRHICLTRVPEPRLAAARDVGT